MCSYIILYMVVMGKRKITKEKFISVFCLSALEKRYCERDGHGQGSAPGARGAAREKALHTQPQGFWLPEKGTSGSVQNTAALRV